MEQAALTLKEQNKSEKEMSEEEKLKRELALVEAALYVAGRPLDLNTLGSVLKTRSKFDFVSGRRNERTREP